MVLKHVIVKKISVFICLLLVNIAFSQEESLVISSEKSENGEVFVYAENTSYAPYTVTVNATLTGFTADKKLPVVQVVNGKSKELLLTLTMKPGLKKYGYSFKSNSYMGNANAKHNDAYTYWLPFKKGGSYLVSQGYYDNVSHHDVKALDFSMVEGSKVYAMREGVVVDVKEDSEKGCPSEECLKLSNFVTVLHDDHSFAEYAHLKKNGAAVKEGDKVNAGDLIGYSGKTGWATGPHLHIEVYTRNKPNQLTSVSTYFNVNGERVLLKKGDRPVNQ